MDLEIMCAHTRGDPLDKVFRIDCKQEHFSVKFFITFIWFCFRNICYAGELDPQQFVRRNGSMLWSSLTLSKGSSSAGPLVLLLQSPEGSICICVMHGRPSFLRR